MHSNTVYDNVIIRFGREIAGTDDAAAYPEIWSEGLRASTGRIAASELPYNFYLTDYDLDPVTGLTPHTFTSNVLFYAVEQDDIPFVEWVQGIVFEGESLSVGAGFLD
jgi:hypothetical protein